VVGSNGRALQRTFDLAVQEQYAAYSALGIALYPPQPKGSPSRIHRLRPISFRLVLSSEVVTSGPNQYRLVWHSATADGGALCGRQFPPSKKLPEAVRKHVKSWAWPWDKEPTCEDCRRLAGLPMLRK
jgi:hypothetical protein